VTASSADEAAKKAKFLVLKDWTSGRYAAVNLNRRGAPRLAIKEISKSEPEKNLDKPFVLGYV